MGADLPWGDLRAAHGVPMEGYFWRFTDAVAGRVIVARPLYLPTSVIPGLAGALAAAGDADADWWLLPVALTALLLVHAATDVCNDVEDAANGIDSPDKMDNSRVFSTGLLSIGEGRRLYAALIAAVLAANNASDIEEDRVAGVRTLAVRIGFPRARALFPCALAGAFLTPFVLCATGLFGPWILLPELTLPVAVACVRQALRAAGAGDEALRTLAPRLAQLHLLFSVLVCAGVVLDRL